MKGIIVKIYLGFLIVCVLVLLYMFSNFRMERMHRPTTEGYEVPTNYTYCMYEDSTAPVGVREEYVFSFPEIDGSYCDLIFYTLHQNVNVYIDGNRVYRMKAHMSNRFGRTSGCVWNNVVLQDIDEDRQVRVAIYPVYESSIGVAPSFYFGERNAIFMDVILKQLPTLVLSLIAILTGLLFVAYTIYNYKNLESNKNLIMLGCFAIIIGLWKLADNSVAYLLLPNIQALYMMPYLMLHLVSAPFVLFVKELYYNKDSKIWYIPIWTEFVGLTVTLGLQLFNILDMRQMLWAVHIELIVTVAVVFGMMIYEGRKKGMNVRMKRNLTFLVICLVGALIDIAVYYITRGMVGNMLGMLGFVIYIFAQGAYSIRDAKDLMNFGKQARTFEQKAYHDQLTGLYNRMAYADHINREDFSPERCTVVVFDLNNLKKCNDTLGHEKGDLYIKECARLIQETFQDIGRCYRMGGDEFTVLLEQVSLDTCKKRLHRLQEAVAERNRKNPEIDMGIASGYEFFDKRIDHDISDTSRRADKKMYHEKFSMKQAKAASGA